MFKLMRLFFLSFVVSLNLSSAGKSDVASNTTNSIKLGAPPPVFTIEETEEEILYDKTFKLFVEENGTKYIIELEDAELWYVTHFYKKFGFHLFGQNKERLLYVHEKNSYGFNVRRKLIFYYLAFAKDCRSHLRNLRK